MHTIIVVLMLLAVVSLALGAFKVVIHPKIDIVALGLLFCAIAILAPLLKGTTIG